MTLQCVQSRALSWGMIQYHEPAEMAILWWEVSEGLHPSYLVNLKSNLFISDVDSLSVNHLGLSFHWST